MFHPLALQTAASQHMAKIKRTATRTKRAVRSVKKAARSVKRAYKAVKAVRGKKARLVKGSKAAKAWMKKIRAKRA